MSPRNKDDSGLNVPKGLTVIGYQSLQQTNYFENYRNDKKSKKKSKKMIKKSYSYDIDSDDDPYGYKSI
jgi:hypothetical protein